MRNPSKVHYEQVNDDQEKRKDDRGTDETPPQGLLMHAPVNRQNLQEVQTIRLFNVDLSEATKPGEPLFYTSINTNGSGDRIFVGGFKDIQFIVNQRNNALGSPGLAGGLYEVIRK